MLFQILNELIHVKHFTHSKHFKMLAIYECKCLLLMNVTYGTSPTRFGLPLEEKLCLTGILVMYYAYIKHIL